MEGLIDRVVSVFYFSFSIIVFYAIFYRRWCYESDKTGKFFVFVDPSKYAMVVSLF